MVQALEAVLEAGRAAWPDLALEPPAFARYVAEHLPAQGELSSALGALHAADLYLAAGCALGAPRALRHFDKRYLASPAYLPGAARREEPQELLQALREHLFVSPEGQPPRIAQYGGRAPLGAWVKMVASRLSIDRHRSASAEAPDDGPSVGEGLAVLDPELQVLSAANRKLLEASFRATLKGLPARDASLLQLHFIEGQTAEAIGRVYDVAGRTVRRWLAEIRTRILEDLRGRLRREHGLAASDLASLERFARDQLDVSITRCLQRSR